MDKISQIEHIKFPIFLPEGDAPHDSPLSIFFNYYPNVVPGTGITLYVCGIPYSSTNTTYTEYPTNEWYTISFTWNYTTKVIAAYIDGKVLSNYWVTTTRPNYNNRPTKIVFGWKDISYAIGYSIKNFRLNVS